MHLSRLFVPAALFVSLAGCNDSEADWAHSDRVISSDIQLEDVDNANVPTVGSYTFIEENPYNDHNTSGQESFTSMRACLNRLRAPFEDRLFSRGQIICSQSSADQSLTLQFSCENRNLLKRGDYNASWTPICTGRQIPSL